MGLRVKKLFDLGRSDLCVIEVTEGQIVKCVSLTDVGYHFTQFRIMPSYPWLLLAPVLL